MISSPMSLFQITESMSDWDEKKTRCPVPMMIIGGFYTMKRREEGYREGGVILEKQAENLAVLENKRTAVG